MKTSQLLKVLGKRFPRSIAKKYHDYVGKMVGDLPTEVNRILLCLDYDESLLEETIAFKPDLILTHHPFIYGKKKDVFIHDPQKEELYHELERLHFPIYSMHTNFDEGRGGMNDSLAKRLNLQGIYAPNSNPMMRIGYLHSEMDILDFAKYAKEKLDVDYGLLINEGKSKIQKVGILGGGGSRDYVDAKIENCDIYISGDISHHTRREIVRYKLNYLDLPHEIEKIFIPTMYELLKEIDSTLEIKLVDHEKLPKII